MSDETLNPAYTNPYFVERRNPNNPNAFYEGEAISPIPSNLPVNAQQPGPQNQLNKDREYNISTVIYPTNNTNGQFIESNCNEITFYNQGADPVTVMGIVLAQFEGWCIGGNRDEMDRTRYTATFVPGGDNQLVVIRKTYVS